MIEFSPDEMAGFEREAAKPYLQWGYSMPRAGRNFSSHTEAYRYVTVSPGGNWALAVMALKFRSGVAVVKSDLWWCENGEGLDGLDSSFDVGTAFIPDSDDESVLVDLLRFVNEATQIVKNETVEPGGAQGNVDFRMLEELVVKFETFVLKHEKPFPEPRQEAVNVVAKALGFGG